MTTTGRLVLLGGTLAAAAAALALGCAGSPWSWLALLVPVGYLALLVVAVMAPRLALYAPVVCHGSTARPEIALTFDDGPHAVSTRKVLAVLARADAHATFFVLGAKAEAAPEVLRETTSAGHEIGIHGYTHDRTLSLRHPTAIAASLERALAAVAAVTGRHPVLFRPPIGHVSPRTAVAARQLGLVLVGWSVRSRDGRARTTAEEATRRVLAGLRPGAIVLMHDAAERDDREPVAATALPGILDEAKRRGLRCVTLSQLLRP
jgi:peptidoglycan/xylan/chitin deacetylase (PgdA/CDA1 family)